MTLEETPIGLAPAELPTLYGSSDRQSLKTRVIDALVDEIVIGKLAPGEKLSESRLARRFGTSRMPVREALIELSRRGMVRIVPQVGSFVTEMSHSEVRAQLEVREALEVQAVRIATQRATKDILLRLDTLLEAMSAATQLGNPRSYVALDEAFHSTIMQATQNSALNEHYRILTQALHREYLALVVSATHGRMGRSLEEHRTVLDRMRTGDIEGAAAAMRAHVVRGGEELSDALNQRRSPERS